MRTITTGIDENGPYLKGIVPGKKEAVKVYVEPEESHTLPSQDTPSQKLERMCKAEDSNLQTIALLATKGKRPVVGVIDYSQA